MARRSTQSTAEQQAQEGTYSTESLDREATATEGAPEEHADVLLMDDDVHLEPEILVRLTAFAASTGSCTRGRPLREPRRSRRREPAEDDARILG